MAEIDDGDTFFDDEFPDIPDDELHRLEQDAITFTQNEPDNVNPRPGRPFQEPRVGNQSRRPTSPATVLGQTGKPPNRKELRKYGIGDAQQNSSGGTFLDEDGLPLVVEERLQTRPERDHDEVSSREQWRVNRFAGPRAQTALNHPAPQAVNHHGSHNAMPNRVPHLLPVSSNATSVNRASGINHNGLENDLNAKIAKLLRERDELATNLQQAQDEVYVRRGEVTNIRAKQSAEEKTYQRQLAAMHKLKSEESERHAATVRAMKAETAQVASEIQFLKQELKEESRKVQAYQRQLKDRTLADKATNINVTPKRSHAMRDGFDDDEMVVVSPMKSGGRRSKHHTPTANRKRKQPTGNEPGIQPLPLRLSGTDIGNEVRTDTMSVKADVAGMVILKDHMSERHLRLIQIVINFRPLGSQETLIEGLFQFSFPSNVKKNFASIVSDRIAKLKGSRLPGDLVQIFLDLWSKAMDESYYRCLSLLIEVISYILDQDPLAVDAALVQSILPIIQTTIKINATARFILARKEFLSDDSKPKPVVQSDINNTSCLTLLYTVASLVTEDYELLVLFWGSVSTETVLMILNACQPIPDKILMTHILTTSILEDTFGPILVSTEQNTYETHICNALGYLLWDTPKPDADEPQYSWEEICSLRQECLNFLAQLTLGSSLNPFNPENANNHGTKFLANHPTALFRLVRCIYDELAAAYNMTPTQTSHIRLVNTATRILHFILLSPAGRQITWQDKIGSINGGTQKFRVAMARLFYAEGTEPGIDAGITEDTVRMAAEILEEIATPDEVEDLVRVFEGNGNRATKRASAIGSTQ